MKVLEIAGKIILLFVLVFIYTYAAVVFFKISGEGLILQNLVFIAATWTLFMAFEQRRGWPLGFWQSRFWRKGLEGMALGIGLISAVFLAIVVSGGAEITRFPFFGPPLWLRLLEPLWLFIFVAISEELTARGYVQGLVAYHYGERVGWFVSSLLFALMHGLNPSVWSHVFPMINLFLAGLLLAIYRDVSGGLWGPIGFHLTWNFFQGSVYGFPVSGITVPSWLDLEPRSHVILSGGHFGAEGSMVTSLALILGIVWLLYKRKRQ